MACQRLRGTGSVSHRMTDLGGVANDGGEHRLQDNHVAIEGFRLIGIVEAR